MAIDLRTEEQRVIDAVVEAKLALDSPLAEANRLSIDKLRAELDAYIPGSKDREQIMLARQAQERDEFSARELRGHNELQARYDALSEKLQTLAANYAKAFDGVRAYYGRLFPSDGIVGQGKLATIEEGHEPIENIRRVLRGDLHGPGVNVETKFADNGDVITRIRRGLHAMGGRGEPPLGLDVFREGEDPYGEDVVAVADSPQEGFEPMPATLTPETIGEALERGAAAIGENPKAIGLDFSLDAEQKG
jgi:hypothetical protein